MLGIDLLAHWMVKRHWPLARLGVWWRRWFIAFWVLLALYATVEWTPLIVAALTCLLVGILIRRANRLEMRAWLVRRPDDDRHGSTQ